MVIEEGKTSVSVSTGVTDLDPHRCEGAGSGSSWLPESRIRIFMVVRGLNPVPHDCEGAGSGSVSLMDPDPYQLNS